MFNLLIALVFDLLFGDPDWFPHPVIGIGKMIEKGESLIRPVIPDQKLAGAVLVCGIVTSCYVLTAWIVNLAAFFHPFLGRVVTVVILFSALSLKSLSKIAYKIYENLLVKDIDSARTNAAHIVGRDTHNLDETEIARATIESVAENSIDGVVAPFFYAFIGGAPLAIAYKAINTLDSMIGYKNEQYINFGWAAAKLDDAANYIPARLSYLLIPIAAGFKRMAEVLNIIFRDGQKHPSPNSGLPEAGFAAALGVQLGGINFYGGVLSPRPLIGDKLKEIDRKDILCAINLLYKVTAALAGLAIVATILSKLV